MAKLAPTASGPSGAPKTKSKNMKRRTNFASACLVLALALTASVYAEEPLKVLLVTGEKHHDYENQKAILSKGVSERIPSEWTIWHHKTAEAAKQAMSVEGWADAFDVVVYNICHAVEKDKAFVDALCKTHHAGKPAVAIHCTMHSYHFTIAGKEGEKEWNRLLGAYSRRHGAHKPITVKKTVVDHPATKEMPAEWATTQGELYVLKKLYDTTTVLAYGDAGYKEGQQPVIWLNRYGAGRIFCTTLGHHNSTMERPEYLDMISKGIKWAAGKDK